MMERSLLSQATYLLVHFILQEFHLENSLIILKKPYVMCAP